MAEEGAKDWPVFRYKSTLYVQILTSSIGGQVVVVDRSVIEEDGGKAIRRTRLSETPLYPSVMPGDCVLWETQSKVAGMREMCVQVRAI